MEILLLLLLAHLLGDYPFQSNWIVKKKTESTAGVLLHVAVLALCYLALLAPYLSTQGVILTILIILIIHFLQDAGKIKYGHFLGKNFSYFLDQIFHLGFSVLLWYYLIIPTSPAFLPQIYANTALLIYAIGFILVTYFYDVTAFVLSGKKIFQRDYQKMAKLSLIYTIIFYATYYVLSAN